jgi:hypothetical protein
MKLPLFSLERGSGAGQTSGGVSVRFPMKLSWSPGSPLSITKTSAPLPTGKSGELERVTSPPMLAELPTTLRPGGHQALAGHKRARSPARAPLPPVAGRRLHRPGQGRGLGAQGLGMDRGDRAPPTEDGSRRGDERMGKGVQQRGDRHRREEIHAPQRPRPFLPKRWIVERTFSWLGQNRRMSKDYERLPESSEAFIYVAMSRLIARRLALS